MTKESKQLTAEELNDKYNEIIEKEYDWKVWQYKGIWCVIARMDMKHLCGYIGLTDKVDIGSHTYEHPWLGSQYQEDYYYDLNCVDVHGGVTWGPKPKCPIPQFEINKELTWIGFDCNHLGDWTPGNPSGEYRTMDYVKQQCNKVVDDYYQSLLDTLKLQIEKL